MTIPAQPCSDEATIARLNALSTDIMLLTKAGRFRRLYPEIEKAVSNGVPHKSVIESLKESGLVLTPKVFSKYLLMERRRSTDKSPTPTQAKALEQKKTVKSPSLPENEYGAHDPRAIDAILRTPVDLEALAKLGENANR